MNRHIYLLIVLAVLISSANAEQYVHVLYDNETNSMNITMIEDSFFYDPYLFTGSMPESTEYRIIAADAEGGVLDSKEYYIGENNYVPYADRMIVYINKGEEELLRRDVVFCDHDRTCEPCMTGGCSLMENSLSCPDCAKGISDNYCSLEIDSACDPDCLGLDQDCGNSLKEPLQKECLRDFFGEPCTVNQTCTGRFVYADDTGSLCCTEGKCIDAVQYEPPTERKPYIPPVEKKTNWLLIIAAIFILAAIAASVYYIRKNKMSFLPLLAFLILSGSMLYIAGQDGSSSMTGMAAKESVIDSYPELFSYGPEKNKNLLTALEYISYEFNKRSVSMTPEMLAAVIATLTKEVAPWGFLPVEEYGDYCSGPGCSYKVAGSCRSSPYEGGCDYKGRGYIQITHLSNYRTYGGDDFLASGTDECDCVGQAYCRNKDCSPAKALKPKDAARIFAGYYAGRGLVALSKDRDYYEVGRRINGNIVYAASFNLIAGDFLAKFNSNSQKTSSLLEHLNKFVPDGTDDPSEDEPGPEYPEDILSGDRLGFYYMNPSFRAETDFDLQVYDDISSRAKEIVSEVSQCVGTIEDCVDDINLPSEWKYDCYEYDNVCTFEVGTGHSVKVFEEGKYVNQQVIVRFALELYTKPPADKICLPSQSTIFVFGDSITEGARLYNYLQDAFDSISEYGYEGQWDIRVRYSGVVGESAYGGANRLDSAIGPYSPQVVLLWYGMNKGAGVSTYVTAYSQMIMYLNDKGIQPVIVTPPYVCHDPEWEKAYFEGIIESAHSFGVPVIDVWSTMKAAHEGGQPCEDWYGLDTGSLMARIHPDANGHSLMAGYIAGTFIDC